MANGNVVVKQDPSRLRSSRQSNARASTSFRESRAETDASVRPWPFSWTCVNGENNEFLGLFADADSSVANFELERLNSFHIPPGGDYREFDPTSFRNLTALESKCESARC